jgi:hypothetical protein
METIAQGIIATHGTRARRRRFHDGGSTTGTGHMRIAFGGRRISGGPGETVNFGGKSYFAAVLPRPNWLRRGHHHRSFSNGGPVRRSSRMNDIERTMTTAVMTPPIATGA